MTIADQVEVLELLSAIDSALGELEQERSREAEALAGKKHRLEELDGRLDAAERSLADMEQLRNELMHEVRQMSVQVDRSREKLSRCRTEREANAGQRELEELRKLYRDRETEIQKLSALADQARGEIEQVQVERGAIASELGSSEGAVTSRLQVVEADLASKREERVRCVARVKVPIYRRYEMVRKRRGTALAFTEDGTCSACHLTMPPMQFHLLKRKDDFDTCPHCQRIIYFRRPANLEGDEGDPAEGPSAGS